ncbi:unnamed protein product [Ceratitis capitata]|uniref:(Mediterranean fruit fly) hypothetical protein n=1 Tax=Ceratitis capitata TaxID=7213 RepID=A0A811V1N4_CERCA|nr:unnamed protein product [Ceratitis capitata]
MVSANKAMGATFAVPAEREWEFTAFATQHLGQQSSARSAYRTTSTKQKDTQPPLEKLKRQIMSTFGNTFHSQQQQLPLLLLSWKETGNDVHPFCSSCKEVKRKPRFQFLCQQLFTITVLASLTRARTYLHNNFPSPARTCKDLMKG